jgi:hypothetical protein
MDPKKVYQEIVDSINDVKSEEDGEHLWDRYQKVTSYLIRLTEIHNEISWLEIQGEASPELKKLRTAILDQTIDRFQDIARFESRKITAKGQEAQLER